MIDLILSLIGGKLPLIAGGIIAGLAALATMLRFGYKAGADSIKAQEAAANVNTIKDIASAHAAGARAAVGRLSDDDGFKRQD